MENSIKYGHATADEMKHLHSLEAQLSQTPLNTALLWELGLMYYDPCHRYSNAVDIFKKIMTIEPKNIEVRYWLANSTFFGFVGKDPWQDAEAYIREAFAINEPECAAHYFLLVSILRDNGSITPEQEEKYLLRSIELAPKWVMNRWMLAIYYKNIRQYNKALYQIEEAIANVTGPRQDWDIKRQLWEFEIGGNRDDLEQERKAIISFMQK